MAGGECRKYLGCLRVDKVQHWFECAEVHCVLEDVHRVTAASLCGIEVASVRSRVRA